MKVLKFGAKWCPGCPIMKPRWKNIEEERPWLKNEMYDYDDDKDIVEKWNVDERLPTFIFLDKDGNEFHRMHGEYSEAELAKIVDENKDK
ncbi:MAG: thioredoxin family protein [Candidatus Peribacteraceae bacterium]|nr:thioredoxin family protein [Candidatus Peribacteraceae bacterium]